MPLLTGIETIKAVEKVQQKPKKKKRAYANAYTRKGEGLAAAIESVTPGKGLVSKSGDPVSEDAPVKKGPKRKRVKAEPACETTEDVKQVCAILCCLLPCRLAVSAFMLYSHSQTGEM